MTPALAMPLFEANLSLQIEKPKPTTAKDGTAFNSWLKENIRDMKPMRFKNIWAKLNLVARDEKEILAIQEYVKRQVDQEGRYNYYFVMFLLDSWR